MFGKDDPTTNEESVGDLVKSFKEGTTNDKQKLVRNSKRIAVRASSTFTVCDVRNKRQEPDSKS